VWAEGIRFEELCVAEMGLDEVSLEEDKNRASY